MKTTFITVIIFSVLLFSCQDSINPEVENANSKADSLQTLLDNRDETVNEFFEVFNEIEVNLSEIKEKEGIITVSTTSGSELSPDAKDRINDDILLIYQLLQENKEKLNYLNKQLKKSDLKILELNKMISRLNEEINNKDSEISKLREELSILNILVDDLNANIDTLTLTTNMQEDIISDQDETIHTAYYVYGTKKELKEQGVITKEGGFIGVGAVEKLREDFNKDYFTKIDIRKTTKIPLLSKKAKLVTTHPAGSYEFKGEDNKVDNITIIDFDAFWSTSKYLVIIIE